MSGNLNINRSVSDPFYRYKMPRLLAKVEGKGNGIKTVLVNIVDVAKALARPPSYPTKFFGCELGAQTQMDMKNERYIVNGAHDGHRLQEMLDVFIKKFVLCPECDNPETVLKVYAKKGVITQNCLACGNQGSLDMRHKLTTFILRNPPTEENTPGGMTAAGSTKKKEKKKEGGNGDGNEVHKEESLVDVPAPAADDDDEDVDWGDDTTLDGVQQRMADLTTTSMVLTQTDELEKTLSERLDIFYEFAKAKKTAGSVVPAEIIAKAEQLEVKERAPLLLAELLFDSNMLAQMKQYRALFVKLCHDSPKAQKYFLGGFEQVVQRDSDALMAKVPGLLKALYDLDILDEEVIIDWGSKASKKYVPKEVSTEIHEKAAPFVKWLVEADEDSEDSEEGSSGEEEDIEVAFSNKVTKPTVTKVSTAADGDGAGSGENRLAGGGGAGDEAMNDDDINIDDI